MIDFIAVKNYAFVFYNFLLVFVLILYTDANRFDLDNDDNLKKKNIAGILLMVVVIVYLGLRPITYSHFGDMGMYNVYFERYAAGGKIEIRKDAGFELFIYASSKIMTAHMFFLTCAFLYIYPLYLFCRKMFARYWYYAFIMLLASYSFWGYGANGIRNGLATTFFLFAMTKQKAYIRWLWVALAFSFHASLLIPAGALLATSYYSDTRKYLYLWLAAIPLSIALGGFWENFFIGFGFGEDERLEGYLTDIGKFDEEFAQTGFRWDFVLYSASGVLAGWYFIIKKKFEDPIYTQLVNMYILANAFWILVIRANYSNRFAYLSWFMLGVIIMYPLLKLRFFNRQHLVIARIVVVYFIFTYLLNGLFR